MEATDNLTELDKKADPCGSAGLVARLQTQLADALLEIENFKAVATISESTKQEAIEEVKQRCQEEVASLHTIMNESISVYKSQVASLESECEERREEKREGRAERERRMSLESEMERAQADSERWREIVQPLEREIRELREQLKRERGQRQYPRTAAGERGGAGAGGRHSRDGEGEEDEEVDYTSDPSLLRSLPPSPPLLFEGGGSEDDTFSCRNGGTGGDPDSFSLGTPCLERRHPQTLTPEQEETASLVSTGTLVPEAIYLPPPGHRLVTDKEWASLQVQLKQVQISLTQSNQEFERERSEKERLEQELRHSALECAKQVSILMEQVQNSESLLQTLQKTLSQSQSSVQQQLAELSQAHQRVSVDLHRLSAENHTLKGGLPPSAMQAVHSEERLRIEIVNLREQLETRTEMCEVLEVQLSSLRTESDRVQGEKQQLCSQMECELQESRSAVISLKEQLSQLQERAKEDSAERAALQKLFSEERNKCQCLQAELDTSEGVQRDFVRLSQILQMRLEQVRQADSLEQIRDILDHTHISDIRDLKEQ
ncbi:rab GTPase-binding effector protein 2 [Polyodon spathula]|uniref:rab GTPase-binding effector protein 2 n=1 Tax=Polyodon spathula TaxID=7913 RepID=UPI001B7ECDA8|nr:rab GTPase-binding effector protein 2 [Polyodon spathula]